MLTLIFLVTWCFTTLKSMATYVYCHVIIRQL